ncbi:Myosin-like IQ motif-containing domain [Plasmopara halstedii]|uniref:Myosin-like IQ motif-containing domain n=1 Tax=Plasmopara halstedii TaxID=4781 RepID=A0A0P1ASL4_PLAHL|nr:Myosin-like IQ motif-containing domain [Plasmopara halstedii]CEG45044.1 Myosin-like IQ motif-containing domain [Plasmopara halstedii]|eukprot:XP_024581413.1 Myosin-like IQ motif-containing domain [Plasmopara halstedii]
MLALKTYGLATASRSGSESRNTTDRVNPPRLCVGGGLPAAREIRSLSKLEILTRTPGHPLYRTTSTCDYGRYLDFEDVALSCPKYSRPAGFTKDFIAGNYTDSSLLSLDNRKRRAEQWQEKIAVRCLQMQVKHAELQRTVEERKEIRRVDREKRRLEMKMFRKAVVQLQARMRGYLTRYSLAIKKQQRNHEAALIIQRATRSHARVRVAKEVVEARRLRKRMGYVTKIEQCYLNYLSRRRATEYLLKLQEVKCQQRVLKLEAEARKQRRRWDAATQIQRLAREYLARKDICRQASSASSMKAEKAIKDALLSVNIRSRSRRASRVVAQMQQVRRKQTKATDRFACLLSK